MPSSREDGGNNRYPLQHECPPPHVVPTASPSVLHPPWAPMTGCALYGVQRSRTPPPDGWHGSFTCFYGLRRVSVWRTWVCGGIAPGAFFRVPNGQVTHAYIPPGGLPPLRCPVEALQHAPPLVATVASSHRRHFRDPRHPRPTAPSHMTPEATVSPAGFSRGPLAGRESREGVGTPLSPNTPALTLPQRPSHTPTPAPTAFPTANSATQPPSQSPITALWLLWS